MRRVLTIPRLRHAVPTVAVGRFRGAIYVVAALIGLDLLVLLAADTWRQHSPDDYRERRVACAAEPRDFVLAGGSPVSEGLIPGAVAGAYWKGGLLQRGYSLGLSGATTTDVYHAVVRSCPTPPQLLVYGIAASDLNDARNEPHGVYSLMEWDDVATQMRVRPDAAEWTVRHFAQSRLSRCWAAYRYRHGIRMWAARTADNLFPGCCPRAAAEANELHDTATALRSGDGYAPARGFVNRRYDVAKATNAPLPPFGFLDRYRTGSHLKYLHRLLDWANANGTTVVLVEMPTTEDLETQYAAATAEFRERLRELEAEPGVIVLRAGREAVGLSDADFADLIHLNHGGARKLSAWLRGRLSEVSP